jgi:hypothetical protein
MPQFQVFVLDENDEGYWYGQAQPSQVCCHMGEWKQSYTPFWYDVSQWSFDVIELVPVLILKVPEEGLELWTTWNDHI